MTNDQNNGQEDTSKLESTVAQETGKSPSRLRHLGYVTPLAPAGGVGVTYVVGRERVAEEVQQRLDQLFPGVRLPFDPVLDLGDSEQDVVMFIQKRPELKDVEAIAQQAYDSMNAIADHYSTFENQSLALLEGLHNHTANALFLFGDAVNKVIDPNSTFGKVVGKFSEIGNWEGYKILKWKLEEDHPDLVARIDTLKREGKSYDETIATIWNEHQNNERELSVEQVKEQLKQDYKTWLQAKVDANVMKGDLAELARGYERVLEAAVEEYKRTGDRGAFDAISQYGTEALSKKSQYQNEHLQELVIAKEEFRETLEKVARKEATFEDLYGKAQAGLEALRSVGRDYPIEEQSGAVEQLVATQKALEVKVEKQIRKASNDQAYVAVNPDPNQPSTTAYMITDGMFGGAVALAVAYAGFRYYSKAKKGLKKGAVALVKAPYTLATKGIEAGRNFYNNRRATKG
ncbi:hypothetical protein ACFLZX_00915 [Nanoarchaeota archaeon]